MARPHSPISDSQVSLNPLIARGESRFTIWLDEEQIPADSGIKPLDNVAVSSTVASDVPIIVERTMWWPGPGMTPDFWTEAHNSPGATETGKVWAVAGGNEGGLFSAQTFVLIANTSAFPGQARVTVFTEDGAPLVKDFALPANSRTNVQFGQIPEFADIVGTRFGALVESVTVNGNVAQLVVERATYSNDSSGNVWAAGAAALGTKLQ